MAADVPTATVTTVEPSDTASTGQLIAAMLELTSIQMELVQRLKAISGVGHQGQPSLLVDASGIRDMAPDTAPSFKEDVLLQRTRHLLSWLLTKVDTPSTNKPDA